jgi:hypothetical protein
VGLALSVRATQQRAWAGVVWCVWSAADSDARLLVFRAAEPGVLLLLLLLLPLFYSKSAPFDALGRWAGRARYLSRRTNADPRNVG